MSNFVLSHPLRIAHSKRNKHWTTEINVITFTNNVIFYYPDSQKAAETYINKCEQFISMLFFLTAEVKENFVCVCMKKWMSLMLPSNVQYIYVSIQHPYCTYICNGIHISIYATTITHRMSQRKKKSDFFSNFWIFIWLFIHLFIYFFSSFESTIAHSEILELRILFTMHSANASVCIMWYVYIDMYREGGTK